MGFACAQPILRPEGLTYLDRHPEVRVLFARASKDVAPSARAASFEGRACTRRHQFEITGARPPQDDGSKSGSAARRASCRFAHVSVRCWSPSLSIEVTRSSPALTQTCF